MKLSQRISQTTGSLIGWLSAPATFVIARMRHARMFHPEGATFQARFDAKSLHGHEASLSEFAKSLTGTALVRLSSAWWRGGREWIDALGCAIRFDWNPADGTKLHARHQDLLFATIRLPITTPFAPLTTQQHDFMSNHYFAVSPFDTPVGKLKFRLVPQTCNRVSQGDRGARLAELVKLGHAKFSFEIRRAALGSKWVQIGELRLEREVTIDQEALRFSPFQAGLAIRPAGFVHYLRPGAYKGSQTARPRRAA